MNASMVNWMNLEVPPDRMGHNKQLTNNGRWANEDLKPNWDWGYQICKVSTSTCIFIPNFLCGSPMDYDSALRRSTASLKRSKSHQAEHCPVSDFRSKAVWNWKGSDEDRKCVVSMNSCLHWGSVLANHGPRRSSAEMPRCVIRELMSTHEFNSKEIVAHGFSCQTWHACCHSDHCLSATCGCTIFLTDHTLIYKSRNQSVGGGTETRPKLVDLILFWMRKLSFMECSFVRKHLRSALGAPASPLMFCNGVVFPRL